MRAQRFCFWHHPDHKAEATEAQTPRWPASPPREDAGGRLRPGARASARSTASSASSKIAALDLLGLDISVARSNAMFRGALVAAKLLEVGDLAQRIAVLEAAFATRQPNSPSPFDGDLPEIDLPSEPSPK